MADVGLEMERILAPIVVHSTIYGYVWIIADDRPISELDALAIESGATIAALMLLHQEALQSAEASLKGGLLAQLIEGESSKQAVLADQALRYGVDLNEPFVLLMIEQQDRGSQKLLQLYRRVNRLSGNWRVIVGQFAGEVLVLAQASLDLPALTESIHAQAGNVRISVSGVQHGVGERGLGLCPVPRRADHHAAARRTVTRHAPSISSSLAICTRSTAPERARWHANPHVPALRRLLDEQQTDLFHTLEVYLDAGGNGVQTAELLCIHRSTLNYRLARIEEICEVKLNDPLVRTNLQIALKLLRLFEVEAS